MYENKKISISFLIIIFLVKISNNYIVLPFKITNIPFQETNDSIIENFLSQININQLYTTISFGNPPKNIDFYLSMEQLVFSVLSNNCIKGSESSYDPTLSSTFQNQTLYNISAGHIRKACLATEKCSFYNDLNLSKNSSFDTFLFLLGNNSSPKNTIDSDRLCGTIGLMRYSYNTILTNNHFIYYLKQNNIIDSYNWGLFYFNNDSSFHINREIQSMFDGFFIAGISNNSYLDIFKTENIHNSYVSSTINWSVNFNKIYYNDTNAEYICSNNTMVFFTLELNYIVSDKNYYENIKDSFFKKYLLSKVCEEETLYKTYEGNNHLIVCNHEIKNNLSSFPNIYFFSEQFSYTFKLDYNDVFFEKNNKIYFLILYKENTKTIWNVGKIFMKKYPFIFDYEKKTISFVHLNKYNGNSNEESGKNENNNLWETIKIYVFIFLFILAIIIGIFIGKIIWQKKRKMRANELDDNYEYIEKFEINI